MKTFFVRMQWPCGDLYHWTRGFCHRAITSGRNHASRYWPMQLSGQTFVRQILVLPADSLDRSTLHGTEQCGWTDVNKIRHDKKRYLILGICLCICNHNVLSLLRCGRLVYHLGLPYSFLSFQYVEESIKIAYCENKCGNCSYTVFSCFILCILGKETRCD